MVSPAIMSTMWRWKDRSNSPGACEFAGETIEVHQLQCLQVWLLKGSARKGLCVRGCGPRCGKAVAIKGQRALSVPNVQNLRSSDHLWKMRAPKSARDCGESVVGKKYGNKKTHTFGPAPDLCAGDFRSEMGRFNGVPVLCGLATGGDKMHRNGCVQESV